MPATVHVVLSVLFVSALIYTCPYFKWSPFYVLVYRQPKMTLRFLYDTAYDEGLDAEAIIRCDWHDGSTSEYQTQWGTKFWCRDTGVEVVTLSDLDQDLQRLYHAECNKLKTIESDNRRAALLKSTDDLREQGINFRKVR